MALALAYAESLITLLVFPVLDPYNYLPGILSSGLMTLGLIMMITGHVFRTTAEMTAGRNFNHQIQMRKDQQHRLVTEGIYQISRHPSYLGWYLWAVGTQVMSLNVVSTIFFIGTSWLFFKERIA